MLLDGKTLAKKIEEKLKLEVNTLPKKPRLDVILIGNNKPSELYVKLKNEACQRIGINSIINKFENISENELIALIKKLNDNEEVNGILIQLPLPGHINTRKVLDSVDIGKDVDGLNSYNLMQILMGNENIIPCTPKGIIRLMEEYNIILEGKNVCIVGFSDVVGKPLATLCLNRGATVTVCHIKTTNLKEHTTKADIIMTATGVPKLIKKDMIKKDSIIIDIGISKTDNKIVGDVDFDNVKLKTKMITPVPGGVGPMTVAALLENTIKLCKVQNETNKKSMQL